jgi:hypothetical protein
LLWFLFFKRRFLLYAISKKSNKEKDAMVNNAITVIFSSSRLFFIVKKSFSEYICQLSTLHSNWEKLSGFQLVPPFHLLSTTGKEMK